MRTREAFRDALARIAAFQPAFSDTPAFTYLPAQSGQPFSRPAERNGATPAAVRPAMPPAVGGETVAGAMERMQTGATSARDLVSQAFAAIAARSDELTAFTYVRPRTEAEAEAAQLDAERRRGALRGPLHGVPIAIKDVIHVAGMPTSSSSRVMDGRPEPRDAAAVARLRAAGALFVGKTSTHEFALGVTTPQSRNPWDAARLPGGSSGGSGIALATGMSVASLGTDTRASIRVPAALCGVVGFKATYGLIPTDGIVTLSWSMDHAAPLTKNMEDAAILLDVLAEPSAGSFRDALRAPVAGLRLGVPSHGLVGTAEPVAAAFARSLDILRGLGVSVSEIGEPDADDFTLANAAGLIVSRAEAAAFHYPWLDRRDRYTRDVGEQLDEARGISAVDYLQAQRYRAALRTRMAALFERFDVLALPTSKVVAPYPEESEGLLLVLSENCVPWSFLGFPAVSLPCGAAPGNLPIGLELVAAPFADCTLLALGAAFESAAAVSFV